MKHQFGSTYDSYWKQLDAPSPAAQIIANRMSRFMSAILDACVNEVGDEQVGLMLYGFYLHNPL
jgi:hypothetical protein